MFRRTDPASQRYLATPVRRRPSLDFSVTGVVYISMMLFMGLAAINSQANLLFGVFGLMIGVLLVSGIISRLVLRKIAVRRVLPDHSRVGRGVTIQYEITNQKRYWPSLSVVVAELDGVEGFTTQPQCYMLHAAPQMMASVPVLAIPKRRGLHQLDRFQVATSFPFGFVKRAVNASHRDVLLVHPPIAEVDGALLRTCRSADTSGAMMRPRPGGADEFYGVKEYRAGDNPRWIYWRRSARSGTMVSKLMTQVAPPRVLLVVDTHLAARTPEAHAAVERCIAMAASLAIAALDQGLSVGLCTWSNGWAAIAPARGKRHKEELLSVLARAPLNTRHDLSKLVEACQRVWHTGTTPVLFTPRELESDGPGGAGGGMLVIPADSHRARSWFRFDPAIDFHTCMPADQQPGMKGKVDRKQETEDRRQKTEDKSREATRDRTQETEAAN